MPAVVPNGPRYLVGPFERNTVGESLARNGTRVRVQGLPYRLLVILVERPGEIVTREEVRQCLWPENTFVEFDNSLGVAIRKVRDALNDDAETPRFVETLPRRGYRFVASVTVLRSETANPVELGGAPVKRPMVTADDAATTTRPGNRSRYWIPGITLVFVLTGITIYGLRSFPKRAPGLRIAETSATAIRTRRSVAVLGFRNLPGRAEDNWLSPAFSEMLATELASDGALRMVPGEDVARVKRELPLADEDSLAKSSLQRLHTNAGADFVVLGSYTALSSNGNKRIRLDVRVQETLRGETLAEKSFTGSEVNLFELAVEAGQSLRQNLGVSSASNEATQQARAALPSNADATRFYVEGKQRLWAFDSLLARDLLIKAIAMDPAYPLAHAALSEAWNRLGYTSKARSEAERARSLSEYLGLEDRLQVEGQYFVTLPDRSKAIETYQKLFAQFPDNLDYGLRLADQQRVVNPQEALSILAKLRHLPAPYGLDPRIDLLEARAWAVQDVPKAQAAATRALQVAKAQGSPVLVARSYGILCQTMGGTISDTQKIKYCEGSRDYARAAGNRDSVARASNDLAGVYFLQGRMEQAETIYREAFGIFKQTGDIDGIATTGNNLGGVALLRGNLDVAGRALSAAVKSFQEQDDKDGVALALCNLGEVARRRGNLRQAFADYEEGKIAAQEINDNSAIGYILTGVGDALLDRGDLDAARKSYQEALSLRKQTGELQLVAETELSLSRLDIEDGHAGAAEIVIRKSKEQFHHENQFDDELDSRVGLMEALLRESKSAAAEKERKDSQALAAKSVNQLLRLQFDLISARVQLANDDAASANTLLHRILRSARAHDLVGIELETRLVLLELNEKLGHSVEAQADLVVLEKLARGKGFGLIANKSLSVQNSKKKGPGKMMLTGVSINGQSPQ
jgi:DNA-binding winged helix-turn-helix (wHTH) protein/tetratricopeptide (TPR) repeat protein